MILRSPGDHLASVSPMNLTLDLGKHFYLLGRCSPLASFHFLCVLEVTGNCFTRAPKA